MDDHEFDKRLASDIRSKLVEVLAKEPSLSAQAAIAKVTKEMLYNNPFLPPEGDKCPIDTLPDELLVHIFETGRRMEIEAQVNGDEDLDEDSSDQENEGVNYESDEEQEVVDVAEEGEDGEEWCDVDEEESTHRTKQGKKIKAKTDVDGEDKDTDKDKEMPFEVLVSHVCTRWRNLALSTSALWTLLYLERGTSLDKHKAYIERSQQAPLGILIECTRDWSTGEDPRLFQAYDRNNDTELLACLKKSIDPSDSSLPDILNDPDWHTKPDCDTFNQVEDHYYTLSEFSDVLDIIIPHVRRWKELTVSASFYRFMYLLLARLHQSGPAEALEVLRLYHQEYVDYGFRHLGACFTPFRGQAPRLRRCMLHHVHINWDASLGFLKNLESIEMSQIPTGLRPSYHTFQNIMKSPRLRYLTLENSGPEGTEDDWRNAGAGPVQLLSLDNLILGLHTLEYARSLLRFIDMPNLRFLTLDYDEDFTEYAKDLCKSSFGRSKSLLAGLVGLRLTYLPCDRIAAEQVLVQLTDLAALTLDCRDEGRLFFEVLLQSVMSSSSDSSVPAKKVLCAALDHLTIIGITGEEMKEFIEARKNAGAPVRRLTMSTHDDMGFPWEQWLKENVEEFDLYCPSDEEDESEAFFVSDIDMDDDDVDDMDDDDMDDMDDMDEEWYDDEE